MTAATATMKTNGTHEPALNGASTLRSVQTTAQQVREDLYSKFSEAMEKTKQEVQEMQKKLKEYDEKLQASATVQKHSAKATEFFKSSLDEIKANLDNLTKQAQTLFDQGKEFTVEKFQEIVKAFNEAVKKLRTLALEFDEKYQISKKVSDLFAPLFARLQSLDKLRDHVKDFGKAGRSYLISTAANLETKYNIESRLSGLDEKYKISETAKQLQERGEEFIEKQNLVEKAKELDEKITGSKAGTYLEEGVKIFTKEWEKIHEEFEIARNSSRENLNDMATAETK